ncbi:histidine kinase [Streptomyces sp. NBC_00654]|uniref:sensor histidine kinase n=1 Tax=Streptomyces sp. NBC_00654 TaxID=2975799 RepID=UPI002254F5D9|nr:histidine kinase [Streptomyces sp. NBC_00654]MCX4963228.1 histidine kinase [Streptomyces sp. NBC_00654]
MWSPWRIVGESLLSVVVGLLGAGLAALDHGGTVRIAAAGLAIAALSLLRRTLPATVLLVAAGGSVLFGALAPLVLVAAWSAGRRIDGVGKAVAAFALAYVLNVGLAVVQALPHLSLSRSVFGVLWPLVAIIAPGLAGLYRAQHHTLADTLREYDAQQQRERAMIAGQARARERQRIAQDMHDSLGHQLVLISVHAGALEVDRELTGRQREAVGVLREASVAAMHELREVVQVMRDGTEVPNEDRTAPGVAAAAEDITAPSRGVAGIEGLVGTSRSVGAAVELRHSGVPCPLPPTADHAAYRIVQEGLTNAHKHAPGAPITVELRYEPDSLVVEVANGPATGTTDNGRGVVSGGQGLTGLGERTRLIGGMAHAGPTADGGFRLAGVLPYTSPEGGVPSPAPGNVATTFVDPTGAFWQQTPGDSSGEGGPVMNGNGLKELAKAMSRKNGSGIAIGCGLAVLIPLLLVIAAVGVGGYVLLDKAEKARIDPKQYDAVKVGQSEAEIRKQLPKENRFVTDGLESGAPPVPKGAECLSLTSTESSGKPDMEPVFRFCFKDGKLIEKKSFEVTS